MESCHLSKSVSSATELLDLPDECLENISAHIDFDAKVALICMNRRLRSLFGPHLLESLKLKKITSSVMECLSLDGSIVRHLDLSNCDGDEHDMVSVAMMCPRLTKLSIVNWNLADITKVLSVSRGLEILRMAFRIDVRPDGNHRDKVTELFASITELQIETSSACRWLIHHFMNLCTALEVAHIEITEYPECYRYEYGLSKFAMERWDTLHTVVLTRHNVQCDDILRVILGPKMNPDILEWIMQDRSCYIYEHGYLNDALPVETGAVENIKLLKQFHSVDFSVGGNIADIFNSRWGSPRSVRVTGPINLLPGLENCRSKMLKELDIQGCHGESTNEFRLDLIASVPCLRELSCSLCFFLPTEANSSNAGDASSLRALEFRETWRNFRRLERLFVKGVRHEYYCGYEEEECECSDYRGCLRCATKIPLDDADLAHVNVLPSLGEFTLNGVHLGSPVFFPLENPSVHTLRLCVNQRNDYSGLRVFLQRCPNLKRFKLDGYDLRLTMRSKDLWTALAEAKNLKQLCLRSGRNRSKLDSRFDEMRDCFLECLRRVEFMHLNHQIEFRFTEALRKFFSKNCQAKNLPNKPMLGLEHFFYRDPKIGRGLCNTETSVGVVPLTGWDIE